MAKQKPELTAVMQGDGSRKVTHPSGVIVIETVEDLSRQRGELVANLQRAQDELTRFDEATT